ncbi:MAG TPA: hypothetical protein VGQ35_17710 [Dongiaceae bacterium]|jgi:hypothetical protein|nr:hypothetical protein [Dongiaceae bacterium]
MKMRILAAASALLAAAAIAVPGAMSDDMDEIDCGSSSFGFAGDGYQLDCQRSNDQVRAGESSGATEVDVMTISTEAPRMFMTVVGIRITATRIYMEHRGLRENFREAFDKIEAEDWKGLGNKDGYDSAEFTAMISGLPSSCVAIQRYSNPAWTGFKRRVIGMGCSTGDREAVYTALAKLRSPGD